MSLIKLISNVKGNIRIVDAVDWKKTQGSSDAWILGTDVNVPYTFDNSKKQLMIARGCDNFVIEIEATDHGVGFIVPLEFDEVVVESVSNDKAKKLSYLDQTYESTIENAIDDSNAIAISVGDVLKPYDLISLGDGKNISVKFVFREDSIYQANGIDLYTIVNI